MERLTEARERTARDILNDFQRYYAENLVCSGDIMLSFIASYFNDAMCLVFYERGDSICWNLETGEVRTLP